MISALVCIAVWCCLIGIQINQKCSFFNITKRFRRTPIIQKGSVRTRQTFRGSAPEVIFYNNLWCDIWWAAECVYISLLIRSWVAQLGWSVYAMLDPVETRHARSYRRVTGATAPNCVFAPLTSFLTNACRLTQEYHKFTRYKPKYFLLTPLAALLCTPLLKRCAANNNYGYLSTLTSNYCPRNILSIPIGVVCMATRL